MSRITLSDEAMSALAGVAEPVEVCDSSGKVRGDIPEAAGEEPALVALARKLFDLKEADRRMAAGEKTYTTPEVLQYLRDLEQSQ